MAFDEDEADTHVLEDVTVLRETDMAMLIEMQGDEIWVPKSVIESGLEVDETGDIEVKMWWAKKNGHA